MQRLILQYHHGDGYTWSATETIPIVHESPEVAFVEFFELRDASIEKHKTDYGWEFEYFGYDFEDSTQESAVKIFTLDEFFSGAEKLVAEPS
jgi:hypothetical protein